ncbi:MAG TPA: catalase family peroxidase [Candidatus Methylacidiphilales bacterium]
MASDESLHEQLVDALVALFGSHPGFRATHAKGIVLKGDFMPSPNAASLSRAAHFQGDRIPVTVRFSNSTGLPTIPDGDPNASPRGLAIKFHLPGDAATDVLGHSFNGFPVGTAEEFLTFLRAVATTPPGAEPSDELKAFLSNHPQALAFAVTPKPAPVSFATISYFGVNAFRFINAAGDVKLGRYFIRPVAGEHYLTPETASTQPPDYLSEEIVARLSTGAAQFRLMIQIAAPGDPTHDASLSWPSDRQEVEAGLLSITETVPDSATLQRSLIFDPVRLTDGIELSDDPLPAVRSGVYSVSYRRRNG